MQKVLIEITDDFVHFKQSGKVCNRWNLKEVNKYTANTIGPKSAEVLVRFCRYGMKRNLITFTPSVQMYQNGHPTHWFLEVQGQKYELENVGDAAEKLISATISQVASEQATLTKDAIELKLLKQ